MVQCTSSAVKSNGMWRSEVWCAYDGYNTQIDKEKESKAVGGVKEG